MIWKIVFWIYAPLFVLIVILTSIVIDWNFVDWLGVFSTVAALVFLYALAYNKRFLSQRLRKVIVTLALIYWVTYIVYLDSRYGAYPGEGLADIIFDLAAVLPVFIPALLYSWQGQRSEKSH